MNNTALLTLESVEGTGLRFGAVAGSGHRALLDNGPGAIAPNPVEMLLIALGGCGGMDVISILRKKRQQVVRYEVGLDGRRRDEHPRSFTRIDVVHRVHGRDVSAAAVQDAIRLSDAKYCSVVASLDTQSIEVVSRYEIFDESGAGPLASGTVDTTAAAARPDAVEAKDAATAPAQPPGASRRHGMSELILRVADVARSVAFYRDVVGIAVEKFSSPTWAWLWSGADGTMPRIGLTSRPLSYGAAHCGGPVHFAIAVPRSAIPAEKQRLESLGLAVEGPVTFEFWKADSIYFSDPDDHRVELCGFEHLDAEGARRS